MLSIISNVIRVATRNETSHEADVRRYKAKQESRRRDEEYYRRWLITSGGRQ